MDPNNKASDDSNISKTGNDPSVGGVNATPQTITSPVAPKLKEQGPAKIDSSPMSPDQKIGGIDVQEADKVAKAEGDEYWESYAREIELEKQILEMGGIEKIEAGEVKVPEQIAKEMGIEQVTNPQTPMNGVTGFSVGGASLSDDQLTAGLSKPTSSGLRWLVEWFIFQLLKAHFHIKRIKNVVTREKA